ncbi:ferrichrome ABC transporter substrate-binding protein [Agaricicola taiwanensis]|uniref:Ferrichrome ABC transporter substrate-binding protein n=1 Tax=Agaricicola taiwanensis TaxID=591372 RepID=A0A8J2YMA6_9RHOB|nr:ABC transporter substrate-binding protein [Agaricicola taiwanensis]GGE54011.1 ferrichrome ABC transporter substrate-binding protein [Agaricicola taiwanensis]
MAAALAAAAVPPAWAAPPPSRLLLGDGHILLALALIHPDPASLIAAWQGDLTRHSPEIFKAYQRKTPSLAEAQVVGMASPDTFSVELALAAEPDLAIFGGCYGPGPTSTSVLSRMKDVGVPVVFVDFFHDPLANTAPSMRRLGAALGGEARDKAKDFAAFHEARLKRIADRLAEARPQRPSVLLQSMAGAPGWNCCWVPGEAGLGTFITFAGGQNIGAELSTTTPWIRANREFVLSHPIDCFVTTGGPHLRGTQGLVIGPEVKEEEAHRTLLSAVAGSEVAEIDAVAQGNVHGFWHLLHATPVNIIAVEALARWLHPDLFSDLDPEATLAEINQRYLALPLTGRFTVSL